MANIIISIRKEAYDFLTKLKSKDKSFSDVTLEFRESKGNKENIMGLFGALKNIKWEKRDKNMQDFRKEFNGRIEHTASLFTGQGKDEQDNNQKQTFK